MFKKSCQILVDKGERKLPWKKFWQFGYTLLGCPEFTFSKNWGICQVIREIKIHVYGIRQTANVSWEFLRIENKQIKTVQSDSYG